ncbi:MAG TPA: isoprenylcysteine carboxylmethyltransferase family protein [Vicinamibacterales bacterium]|nr:isoprenylcysteine carboxylmethyltransferase family protein [Vicinamibacterales bacterium]
MTTAIQFLARRRVTLGFVTAIAALVLAAPTWASWRYGLAIAVAGEAIRIWAAGHLEKSREVTQSGPYRWTRHPLYVGSSVMAGGIVVASRSVALAVLTAVYMVSTVTAAIRTEEAFLRRTFGETYDRYARSQVEPVQRRFSAARVWRNREYRAMLGLTIGFALLAAKLLL